jgi:hypothetical protein
MLGQIGSGCMYVAESVIANWCSPKKWISLVKVGSGFMYLNGVRSCQLIYFQQVDYVETRLVQGAYM